jgi:hypothetical protein
LRSGGEISDSGIADPDVLHFFRIPAYVPSAISRFTTARNAGAGFVLLR